MLQNCVLRRYKSIPISCPVRVVHGLQDKVSDLLTIQRPSKLLFVNSARALHQQLAADAEDPVARQGSLSHQRRTFHHGMGGDRGKC